MKREVFLSEISVLKRYVLVILTHQYPEQDLLLNVQKALSQDTKKGTTDKSLRASTRKCFKI